MVITIQRTSKPLKAFSLFSKLMFFYGFYVTYQGEAYWGGELVATSIFLWILARTLIWWNHA